MKRDLKLWKCDGGTYDVLDYYDVCPETCDAAIVATNVPVGVILHWEKIMAALEVMATDFVSDEKRIETASEVIKLVKGEEA